MSKNSRRAIVIGLGVGRQHADFLRSKDWEVVTVDRSQEADFTSAEAALDTREGHLCVVASHDPDHFYHIKMAWERGMDVFCEKPICIVPCHLKEIAQIVRNRPEQRFCCNFPLRAFFPKVKKPVPIMNVRYNYGRLRKLGEWRAAFPYSIALGGGVHMIDLALLSFKERVVSVFARGNNINGLKMIPHTCISALCRMESGAILNIICDFTYDGIHEHRVDWRNGKDMTVWVNQASAPKTWCLERFINGKYEEPGFDAHSVAFAIDESLREHREVLVKYQ